MRGRRLLTGGRQVGEDHTMADDVVVTEEGYEGKYVALRSLTDRKVVASGDDPAEVLEAAKQQGAASPVIVFVPESDMTFIY